MLDRLLVLVALITVAALSPVLADDHQPACFGGLHAGTGGVGGGGGCELKPGLVLRLAIEGIDAEDSQNIDGVEYELAADLGFTRLQLDWFPTPTGFYLSGGLAKMNIDVDGTADPTAPIQVGSITVQPADLGYLDMSVDFKSVSPYVGLGWLTSFGNRVSLRSEIGVSSVDSPEVSLVERETSFIPEADIQAEVDEVLAEYDDALSLYPYVKFGLEYRF